MVLLHSGPQPLLYVQITSERCGDVVDVSIGHSSQTDKIELSSTPPHDNCDHCDHANINTHKHPTYPDMLLGPKIWIKDFFQIGFCSFLIPSMKAKCQVDVQASGYVSSERITI